MTKKRADINKALELITTNEADHDLKLRQELNDVTEKSAKGQGVLDATVTSLQQAMANLSSSAPSVAAAQGLSGDDVAKLTLSITAPKKRGLICLGRNGRLNLGTTKLGRGRFRSHPRLISAT